MFKIFKKKEKSALEFLKDVDVIIADAYRANDARELKDYCELKAFRQIQQDITAHKNYDSCPRYYAENLHNREYEIVSEDDNTSVIRRTVSGKDFKTRKGFDIITESFTELFTITKKDGNMMITNFACA